MAKDTAFKTELTTKANPRIFRKGYLFRETGPDSNGRISSYHSAKTLYKGSYDHNKLAIFMDPNPEDWDHFYGSIGHCDNTALPDDSNFLTEVWTKSTPAGTAGTSQLFRNGSSTISAPGNLLLNCSSAQTVLYTKTGVIDDITSSSGNFSYEIRVKQDSTSTASATTDFLAITLKMGQFHTRLEIGTGSIILRELSGGSITSTTNSTNVTTGTEPNGPYITIRVVIDKAINSAITTQAKLYINGAIIGGVSKTATNGSTSDNSISFGLISTPSATFKTYIQYLAYISAPIHPMEQSTFDSRPTATAAASAMPGYTTNGTQNNSTSVNIRSNSGGLAATTVNCVDFDDDIICTRLRKSTAGTLTYTKSLTTTTNSPGFAFETMAKVDFSGGNGNLEFKIEDGTRNFSFSIDCSFNRVRFNGNSIANPIDGNTIDITQPHKYRLVCSGTGASSSTNAWLYIDDQLAATGSITTATANTVITITPVNQNASGGTSFSHIYYTKLINRPQHPNRRQGIAYIAWMDEVLTLTNGDTVYYSSMVTNNNLNTNIAAPRLGTCTVFQKDLGWGDTGFTSVGNLEQRGSNSVFVESDVTPSFSAITVPSGSEKRDPITIYPFQYFQVQIPLTNFHHQITFIRFHRQVDVSDYVLEFGSSTFEKDFITRKINIGNIRVKLMANNDDFDTFRTRPDIWLNCGWETWIGAITDSGTFQYPDFIGQIDDMVFDNNGMNVVLEVSNNIKKLKEKKINVLNFYPPYVTYKTYMGDQILNVSLRSDPVDPKMFIIDSKYDLTTSSSSIIIPERGTVAGVGFQLPAVATLCLNRPGRLKFDSTPSSSEVILSFFPPTIFKVTNAATLLNDTLQMDAKLILNYDIDNVSLATYKSGSSSSVRNIILDNTNLFDFLEKITTQTGATISISPENQTAISFSYIGNASSSHSSITDKTLVSSTIHTCENIVINNPVENVMNVISFTYSNSTINTSGGVAQPITNSFVYINTRTIGSYDSTSPNAASSLIDFFGIISPSEKITNNVTTFFNIDTEYLYITSISDMNNVVDDNFAIFGFRPPIYELQGIHVNNFLYNMGDTLYIHRTSATTPDDSIIITRIERDYDNLTGNIQGISSQLFEAPGGF